MTLDSAPGIRVVIADDHAVVRRGTREILEQSGGDILVVGEAQDGIEAVKIVEELIPDVAILDIGMPKLNGVEATRRIRDLLPTVGVLMLTVQIADEYVWQAVQAGASGYLLKDVGDQELVEAVQTIAAGGASLDQTITHGLLERMRRVHGETPSGQELRPRELDVLRLAAQGLSNRQIGEALGLSPRTVEVHMGKVFAKVGASSRTEAVVIAARRGFVHLEDRL